MSITRIYCFKNSIGEVEVGNSIKRKIERTLAKKRDLNKKVLQIQKSFHEVSSILNKKKK